MSCLKGGHGPVRGLEAPLRAEASIRVELDIFPYRNMIRLVPRASTTSDAFNAVAEPRRREILEYLGPEERAVGDIAVALDLGQPSVSKHLQVLLNVGLVEMRRDGRRTLYRTNADGLRPVHEWTGTFARYWGRQLRRIKDHAEAKQAKAER